MTSGVHAVLVLFTLTTYLLLNGKLVAHGQVGFPSGTTISCYETDSTCSVTPTNTTLNYATDGQFIGDPISANPCCIEFNPGLNLLPQNYYTALGSRCQSCSDQNIDTSSFPSSSNIVCYTNDVCTEGEDNQTEVFNFNDCCGEFVFTSYYRIDNGPCSPCVQLPDNPSGGADPHFMCPLKNGNNICFSVQGIPDFIFNLFSDSYLQLNAKFALPEFEESRSLLNSSTFMQELGFTVKHPITNIHTNVKISALDHSILVAGSLITVKNYPMIIKIINSTVTTTIEATPVSNNPGETAWVKIITDVNFSLKLKFVKRHLDFVIIDSSGLSKQAHGIQGQFMGPDVFVSTDKDATIMKIGNHRAPFAIKLGKIWPYLNIPGACWYPVNSNELGEGVIEGVYTDYIVNDLFGNNFKYNQFN